MTCRVVRDRSTLSPASSTLRTTRPCSTKSMPTLVRAVLRNQSAVPRFNHRVLRAERLESAAQPDSLIWACAGNTFAPISEKNGTLSNLILGPAGQELTAARIEIVDSLYPSDRNNFRAARGLCVQSQLWRKVSWAAQCGQVCAARRFRSRLQSYSPLEFANTRGNPPFFARYRILLRNISFRLQHSFQQWSDSLCSGCGQLSL